METVCLEEGRGGGGYTINLYLRESEKHCIPFSFEIFWGESIQF